MKCSSRLLCGFLMSCLCFRGSSEKLTVNQNLSIITVNEGESAQIFCCWKTIHEHKVKVVWFINETKLSGVKEHQTQNCSTLDLTNILKNHTGHYICEVTQDIPVLLRVNGTGTDLSVSVRQLQKTTTVPPSPQTSRTESKSTTSDSVPILPLSLTAAIVLVTLCLTFSLCKMRNSCKTSERVVIRQTPHSEGEEHEHMEEEDGSTGSSRGSLQWYQVPVYWSYFDLQRGAEDK